MVTGASYLVKSEEEAQMLARYETNVYEVTDCWIFFKDREEPDKVVGKVLCMPGMRRRYWNNGLIGSFGGSRWEGI